MDDRVGKRIQVVVERSNIETVTLEVIPEEANPDLWDLQIQTLDVLLHWFFSLFMVYALLFYNGGFNAQVNVILDKSNPYKWFHFI